jgi:hypothetical protein
MTELARISVITDEHFSSVLLRYGDLTVERCGQGPWKTLFKAWIELQGKKHGIRKHKVVPATVREGQADDILPRTLDISLTGSGQYLRRVHDTIQADNFTRKR